MASFMRMKAATGLSGLSRAAIRVQPISALSHSAILCQRGAVDPQRRLFSNSGFLNGSYIVSVPPMAESITEGTLSSLAKKVGEQVEQDEEIASIETDKIDVLVNANEPGSIAEYFVEEGDTVVVGQDLARIVTGEDAGSVKKSEGEEQKPTKEEPKKEESKPDEQPAKSEEKQSAPAQEPPKPSKPAESKPAPKESKPTPPPKSASSGPARGERVEKMTRMRKTIAARLKQSQNTCASLTTIQEVDMSNLIAWRAKYKEEVAEEHGVRLGYMGAFTKATTMAAQKVPQINATIDTEKEIITYKDYVDVSIAVSAPKGLVTPVLRNTHELSIVELEREVASAAKKARDGKLTMEDMEGGSFSISNPGIFGSMFGTPVINYPQAAVFNMNGIRQEVVAINGEAVIRPMMYISLTYDHRLIDGREAVTFLNTVKKYIEDPSRMLLA
ncbi:probable KGD2 - 2-oxoglutarate dehydrogenase complex E2 component [Fusarium torulosum]|uniref:dihydrolipoyllysine-residue succinyltransferase n=1 Tax=Fusarium torulosum TaxID=33205 RepID=A0AAE8SCI1_9HYPO|nr:probable KGD2 - 2-oxoglutarate dehydrogenase complex E2 component [Fusarium torulosum]